MSTATDDHVLRTPVWVTIVRAAQAVLSLIVLGLSSAIIHDLYIDELGLAVATSVLTWAVVAYALFSEKMPGLHALYHVIAIIALDGFMVIMWLSTFASVAARRATYVVPVNAQACFNDGSTIDSETCLVRRGLEKRGILFKSGQAMMSASAGLGALVWLLFVATFVWTMINFAQGRKEGRFKMSTGGGNVEAAAMQQVPLQSQQYQSQYAEQNNPQMQYQQQSQQYQDQPQQYQGQTQQYAQQAQQPQQYQQPAYQAALHTGQSVSPVQSMPSYHGHGHGSELSSTPAQGQFSAPPTSPAPQ